MRRGVQFSKPFSELSHKKVGLQSALRALIVPNIPRTHSTHISGEDKIECSHLNRSKLLNPFNQNIAGFCLDIGAPRSVIGLKELNHIT